MAEPADPRRRTFGPVVLLGVLAGVAAAVAGTQPWFDGEGARGAGDGGYASELAMTIETADAPAVNALALVGLACWGVVLVSRGRFRRYVAVLGLLSAVGVVAAAVNVWLTVPDDLTAGFRDLALPDPDVSSTGWSWVGSAAAVVALAAWAAAVVLVRRWPEMGTRYDTPRAAPTTRSETDLWKVMDEGRDPTS